MAKKDDDQDIGTIDLQDKLDAAKSADHDLEANAAAWLYELPDHTQVDYESVLPQPKAYDNSGLGKFMSGPLNMVFRHVYNYTQTGLYFILVAIVGIFLAFAWAVLFALGSFCIVWAIQPMIKLTFMFFRIFGTVFRTFVRVVLDPLFQSIGQIWSGIRGKFRLTAFGLDQVLGLSPPGNGPKVQPIDNV